MGAPPAVGGLLLGPVLGGAKRSSRTGCPNSLAPSPRPVFLSFFGIASIGLSCLAALFLYHVVFGVQYLGILNGVAAFVIVGIGELCPRAWLRARAPKGPPFADLRVQGSEWGMMGVRSTEQPTCEGPWEKRGAAGVPGSPDLGDRGPEKQPGLQ